MESRGEKSAVSAKGRYNLIRSLGLTSTTGAAESIGEPVCEKLLRVSNPLQIVWHKICKLR